MATLAFPLYAQLDLSRRTTADGRLVVTIRGELDIAGVRQAHDYLRQTIDRSGKSVTVELSGLKFCDAAGLGVLARAAAYAREAGRPLRLTGARPSLLRIMRITELDLEFPELGSPAVTMVTQVPPAGAPI